MLVYKVISKFFDNMDYKANFFQIEAEEKPESVHVREKDYDYYEDYFLSREQALKFYNGIIIN